MARRRFAFLLLAVACLGATAPLRADEDPPGAGPTEEERAEIRRLVDELREQAARIRGLEWKETCPADLLSRAQVRDNMAASIHKEITPEELARDVRILRRLGYLAEDEDPIELFLAVLEQMIGGYYDPDTRRLYLVEGMTGEAQKPVILHELVHALEDQHIDLKARTEAVKDDYDRIFVEKCIQEGSAEHAALLFQRAHPEVARAHRAGQASPEMAQRQMRVLSRMPAALVVGMLLWYQAGPAFVARAVGDDYPGGIAALYANPPASQEQILHPRKWFGERQDWPQQVAWAGDFAAAAGEGWSVWHDHGVGQLDLALWFDRHLGFTRGKVNLLLMQAGKFAVPRATEAARGWDAGRAVYLSREGLPLAWIQAHAFDTVEDGREAAEAFLDSLRKQHGEAFEGGTWRDVAAEGRVADFQGAFGHGRLRHRGAEILLVDGLAAETLEAVWAVAAKTTFVRDPRDTWDPAAEGDPLAGADLADPQRSVGVRRPDATWSLAPATQPQGAIATLRKGGVTATVLLAPAPFDAVQAMVEPQLERVGVDVASPLAVPVGPSGGLRYGGPEFDLYLGRASAKTLMVRAEGPQAERTALDEELRRIARDLLVAED
jgi:hypothetical protein